MHRTLALYSFVLLLCAGAHSSQADSLEATPIPIEAFFEPVKDYGFAFSPDGNHLAYISREGTDYFLSITNLDQIKIVGTHLLSSYPVHRIFWLNNNRLLYESLGLIRAINIDGGGHKTLIDHTYGADSIRNAAEFYKNFRAWRVVGIIEGSEEILASSRDREGYMHIHRINIYSGDKVDIIDGNKLEIHEWFTDMSGRVRIGLRIADGESELFGLTIENEKPVLTPLVLEKGKYTFSQESPYEQRATIAGFAPNGNFLYLCENINSDTFRLVGFDLAQDKIVRLMADDKKYDVCGPGISMQPLFHDRNTRLVGIRYERDKSHTLLYDDEFRAIQNTIDKKYKNRINNILGWTPDLGKVLFHSYNEKDNGRIYIYYTKEKKVALQSYGSPNLEKFETESSTRPIEYKTRDNHPVEAYLTTPPNPKNTPLPLIVMPHGSPFLRDTWTYNPYAQFFASRGYAVLQPNYRGTVGYGRNHLKPALKEPVNLMTDDIADGVMDLIKSGVADKNRVFIFGQSYGGYAAAMSTIRHPDLYRAAVSAFAPLDLVSQVDDKEDAKEYFAGEFWRDLAGNPKKEKAVLKEMSPYHRVKEIKVPLFIFYGEEDPIIPIEQLRKFEKIKDKAPAEIKTMVFKKEGHGFTTQNNNVYFLEKTLEFFKNNLKQEAENDRQ